MKPAGYSKKALIANLGYSPGDTILLKKAPEWFVQYLGKEGILSTSTLPTTWAHLFVTEEKTLREIVSKLDWAKN